MKPQTVSLVGYPCQIATNALVVNHVLQKPLSIEGEEVLETMMGEHFDEKKKEDLVICHKFLFNELQDNSVR